MCDEPQVEAAQTPALHSVQAVWRQSIEPVRGTHVTGEITLHYQCTGHALNADHVAAMQQLADHGQVLI